MTLTIYDIEFKVAQVCKTSYVTGNLAILLFDTEGDEICCMTVNLPEEHGLEDNQAFVDTNNCTKSILKFIEDNDLGVATGRTAKSGYCEYPLYTFDLDKLIDID